VGEPEVKVISIFNGVGGADSATERAGRAIVATAHRTEPRSRRAAEKKRLDTGIFFLLARPTTAVWQPSSVLPLLLNA
jgi:hypothetical protein